MDLVLRSVTVLSGTAVAVAFVDDAGREVTYQFTAAELGGITLINGEDAFTQRYRRAPGPAFPLWPERLVRVVLAAYREPLPTGESLERLSEDFRQNLTADWEQQHRREPE